MSSGQKIRERGIGRQGLFLRHFAPSAVVEKGGGGEQVNCCSFLPHQPCLEKSSGPFFKLLDVLGVCCWSHFLFRPVVCMIGQCHIGQYQIGQCHNDHLDFLIPVLVQNFRWGWGDHCYVSTWLIYSHPIPSFFNFF